MTSEDSGEKPSSEASEIAADRALLECRGALGKWCMAVLGDQNDAQASLEAVEYQARSQAAELAGEAARGVLFGIARGECARRLERRTLARRTAELFEVSLGASTPARARALLAGLHPSEREVVALRAVAALAWGEVAQACGADELSSKRRAARALVRLGRLLEGRTIDAPASNGCEALEAHLVDVLDGTADEADYVHLSACDRCRDLRHEAERAFAAASIAGNDFSLPLATGSLTTEPLPTTPAAVAAPASPDAAPPLATESLPATPAATTEPPPEGPAAAPAAAGKEGTPKVDRGWVLGSALVLVAAVALGSRLGSSGNEAAEHALSKAVVARVSGASASGFAACAPSGSPCQTLEQGARVPMGSRVKTDFSTRAALTFDDGSELSLERGAELVLAANGAPELLRGNFVAEIRGVRRPATLELPQGSIRSANGKIAIRTAATDSIVEVARGTVEVEDRGGNRVTLRAGEQSRLGGGPPLAIAAPSLGASVAWSERLEESKEPTPRGLGELVAKKPGTQTELEGAVRLASHQVRVRISGAVARTEVEELFTNTTGDVLEGIYRFPLPPDAKIERLALEVDGKLMEGAFVERDRAAAIWRGAIVNTAPESKPMVRDEIVWVPGPWKDPALLEWQRGGRFELRIFPIPKHGSRRIVLAYTEVLRPAGEARRYVYPLPHDPSGSTRVDQFRVDVQVRGHDPGFPVRASGYELTHADTSGGATLAFSRQGFAPSGDLTVEYALPERRAELSAWAYRPESGDEAPYVALALRPRLPRVREDLHRNFAIVVDSSRSMYGESFERAKRVAARLVRELDPDDRVVVLACDSECATGWEGPIEPGLDAEARTRQFLDAITPDGASDPARAQALAYEALSPLDGREGRIVYIGDGAPTMGPIRPDHLEQLVARALPKERVRVTAVAVGTESDLETLAAIARGGGGVLLPYTAGQSVAEAAYDVLGAAYGSALRNVSVRLPDGLYAAAPSRLDAIPAGGEVIVVARMRAAHVDGDVVLRGEVGGERFEQRYVLRAEASSVKGNAFVPRLYAALRIADLERDGSAESREDAVKISTAFNVQSRFTSLLVLESQAMFKAFGLEQKRQAPEWSGEEDAEATVAEGELAFDDRAPSETHALAGSSGAAAPRPAAAPKSAKRAEAAREEAWAAEDGFAAPPPAAVRPRAPRALGDGGMIASGEAVRPRMVPMRRIWVRAGEVTTARSVPKQASHDAIAEAERKASLDENRRELTRKLHGLLAAASDLERVETILDRWLARDPFDPDALTARADLAARRGERERAIRLLGSVVDARPGDVGAQRRLERLHRWAGRPAVGCRHLVAASELRPSDAELLTDAIRCSRATGETDSADRLLAAATPESRRKAETLLRAPAKDDSALRGDLRVEATWSGGADIDLALVDADGARFSWLGAPTRQVIMARDVVSTDREGLAVRGAKPGEYVIELVRSAGGHPVSGEVSVSVAGTTRRIPFQLSGTRATLGLAVVRMQPRLVPL